MTRWVRYGSEDREDPSLEITKPEQQEDPYLMADIILQQPCTCLAHRHKPPKPIAAEKPGELTRMEISAPRKEEAQVQDKTS